MSDNAIQYILWVFALYGMYMLAAELWHTVAGRKSGRRVKKRIILKVGGRTDNLEAVIRELDYRNRMMRGELFDEIRIINLSSERETAELIEKFAMSYPYIYHCIDHGENYQ